MLIRVHRRVCVQFRRSSRSGEYSTYTLQLRNETDGMEIHVCVSYTKCVANWRDRIVGRLSPDNLHMYALRIYFLCLQKFPILFGKLDPNHNRLNAFIWVLDFVTRTYF